MSESAAIPQPNCPVCGVSPRGTRSHERTPPPGKRRCGTDNCPVDVWDVDKKASGVRPDPTETDESDEKVSSRGPFDDRGTQSIPSLPGTCPTCDGEATVYPSTREGEWNGHVYCREDDCSWIHRGLPNVLKHADTRAAIGFDRWRSDPASEPGP